jgi:glutamate-1-semialdehyde 2,1-aminomutase
MEHSMKVVAIVQARIGSTRFPAKVMQEISSVPMIELLLNRLSKSRNIDEVILATSENAENNELRTHIFNLGYTVYQGSENDVLDRYYQAAKISKADIVVRITGDCPLVDARLVDKLIENFIKQDLDYYSNVLPPTFPDGLDVEVFSFESLEKSAIESTSLSEREHVTQYMQESGLFRLGNYENNDDCSSLRWTVDEPEDFDVISNVFNYFYPNTDFSWEDVLQLSIDEEHLFKANKHLIRDEGALIGTGQKLWKRAKKVIPGGNMLLSKRAEMFLPEQWPTYFSKAKGCKIWDMDNNEYTDMYLMGVGTNILGYGHNEVDEAVSNVIYTGNMSTLNCPEEVYLAEKLIELHPWAGMARFARSGGEANSIAVRIARAYSGKDKIAVCGYHGWHDWYLAANINNEDNLSEHLLPGLDPAGVPQHLANTIYPFRYNSYDQLENIISKNDIGVIKMEVCRNEEPKDDFLQKVRKLATDKNIVLIFDECTSGFRQTFGGLHKYYDVEPDIAIFGKALGNGYAITATIGRKDIMQAAQNTFISSTFWTEKIGSVAALKTLDVMERNMSWEKISKTGSEITKRWGKLASKYDLNITTYGLSALTGYAFSSKNDLAYKTLITQEMLRNGFLAGTSVYVCTEHSDKVVSEYFEILDPIFAMIQECEDGKDVMTLLNGPVCHDGFKRLN